MKKSYFSDPIHSQFREHYIEAGSIDGCVFLAFSLAWKEANLPKSLDREDRLVCALYDTEDGGREYETKIVAAYEDVAWCSVPLQDWSEFTVGILQPYFYSQHHCDCHRRCDANEAGAGVDEECHDVTRFLITRIYHPSMPHVILYSETLSINELEDRLAKGDRI